MKRACIHVLCALLWLGGLLVPGTLQADRADFGGTWTLDLDASDSPEALLAAQGFNILVCKFAGKMAVTHAFSVGEDEITLVIDSLLRKRTQHIITDRTLRPVDTERGPGQVYHYWTAADALVSVVELDLSGVEEQATIWRTLSADGRTMTQRITLEQPDHSVTIHRIFRRL